MLNVLIYLGAIEIGKMEWAILFLKIEAILLGILFLLKGINFDLELILKRLKSQKDNSS